MKRVALGIVSLGFLALATAAASAQDGCWQGYSYAPPPVYEPVIVAQPAPTWWDYQNLHNALVFQGVAEAHNRYIAPYQTHGYRVYSPPRSRITYYGRNFNFGVRF